MNFIDICKKIEEKLKIIPKSWDGKKAIAEMKNVGYSHWRQMEWMGFYFQYLCRKHLSKIMEIPGKRYDNVAFDAFKEISWDFKAHAMNTSSHQIIVNDTEAISKAIKDNGAVGLILALGKVEYNDEERNFQKWHDRLKGKETLYVRDRIKRGAWSRLRKVSFDLQQISFIEIKENTLIKCGSFQKNFRNSDGSPRKSKLLIDLENIKKELVYVIEFKA